METNYNIDTISNFEFSINVFSNNKQQNNIETTITTLIKVMNMVFIRDKIKRTVNIDLPRQGHHE
jgi:hypothetical protein